MEKQNILDTPLFTYMKENQSVWAKAYQEQQRKYKYEKQKNEKRRAKEKKEALLKVGVIEVIEQISEH